MNSKDDIIIIGAGGHGKVVLDILLESGRNVAGFLDDDKTKAGKIINGVEVLGDLSYLRSATSLRVALGIGDNAVRRRIYGEVQGLGLDIVSAIHPRAIVSRSVRIGKGVVIMPGCVINPSTVMEDGVVINTMASIDHDCRLDAFSHIWPGAHLAGGVQVGENSYVGAGANIIQNIRIGKNVVIGAGAVVITDIPDDVTAVGVPAKIIKRHIYERQEV